MTDESSSIPLPDSPGSSSDSSSDRLRPVDWDAATWLNPPASVTSQGTITIVTTKPDSDYWRTTAYGFVHDNGHCLLTDFPSGSAVEVSFVADLAEQFDQAGLMVCTERLSRAASERPRRQQSYKRISILPVFPPLNRARNASTALSRPS